jgi:hypothetical protein
MMKGNATVGEAYERDAAEKICDSMFIAKEEAIMIVMSLSMPRLTWGKSDLLPVNTTQASTSIVKRTPAINTHVDTANFLLYCMPTHSIEADSSPLLRHQSQ